MTLNVLSELIGGFVVPGRALAMNMFKAYGTITIAQAIGFVETLKIGHYTKIPPRAMFRAQTIPTLLSIVIVFALIIITDLLDPLSNELADR